MLQQHSTLFIQLYMWTKVFKSPIVVVNMEYVVHLDKYSLDTMPWAQKWYVNFKDFTDAKTAVKI